MKLLVSVVFASAILAGSDAVAGELKVFTSRALATVLEVVGPEFEQTSGHKLNVSIGFTPEFASRIADNEPFDLLMAPAPAIDRYIKEGTLKADTRTMLVSSDVGREGGRAQAGYLHSRRVQDGSAQGKVGELSADAGCPAALGKARDCRSCEV
jgi:hypothetical protein